MSSHRQVIQAAEARALALAHGDSEALRALLHEDFRWTSHTGETFRRDAYIHRNTMGPVRWRSQQLSDVEVMVVGDAAVLHAWVTDEVDPGKGAGDGAGDGEGGGAETFRMPMTQVWVRQDNVWRCLAGHAGPRRPQGQR